MGRKVSLLLDRGPPPATGTGLPHRPAAIGSPRQPPALRRGRDEVARPGHRARGSRGPLQVLPAARRCAGFARPSSRARAAAGPPEVRRPRPGATGDTGRPRSGDSGHRGSRPPRVKVEMRSPGQVAWPGLSARVVRMRSQGPEARPGPSARPLARPL
jgi:hypothetical protein